MTSRHPAATGLAGAAEGPGPEGTAMGCAVTTTVHGRRSADSGSAGAVSKRATGGTRIWMVRHGQRIDETDEAGAFYDSEWGRARGWDPPLTVAGMRQARETAQSQLRPLHDRVHFTHVLVSPLLRTLQTAREICHELGLPAIVVEPFCKCAAAVKDYATAHDAAAAGPEGPARRALKAGRKSRRQVGLDILHDRADIERCCAGLPMLPESEIPAWARVDRGLTFLEACHAVASRAAAAGVGDIMVVTHREGIRDLGARTVNRAAFQHRISTPYCCVAEFEFRRADAAAAAAKAAAKEAKAKAKAAAKAEAKAARAKGADKAGARGKGQGKGKGKGRDGGDAEAMPVLAADDKAIAAAAATPVAEAATDGAATPAVDTDDAAMAVVELDPFADLEDAGTGASDDTGDDDGEATATRAAVPATAAAGSGAAAGGAGAAGATAVAGTAGGGGGDGDALEGEGEDATGMTAHGPCAWEWHLAADPEGGFARGVRPSPHVRTPFEDTA